MESIDLKALFIDAFDHAEKKHRSIIGEEAYKKELRERFPDAYKRGYEQGRKEAREEIVKPIAKKLKETQTPEVISEVTGLSINTILLL